MAASRGASAGAGTHTANSASLAPLTVAEVFRNWLPLAASWAVMGMELPLVSAIMARQVDPALHLAAYGGVVFPVALIVEAPVIMLLAASVALAHDRASYRLIYRFMMYTSAALTVLHALLAFTPLFDLVLVPLFGPPEGVIEPARLGLKIMLPWTWAIGYRRFQQGLLIRFNRSHHVSIGTVVRLVVVAAVALLAAFVFGAPGIVTATAAIAVGVTVEAVYSAWAVRPVLLGPLARAAEVRPTLTLTAFLAFFVPLVLTSFLSLLIQPIGSAAMARMPQALESLAVWPVASGLLFILRAVAFALNEVVVALLDRPGALSALRRFTVLLALGQLAVTALVAFTPAARFWFADVSGLAPTLTVLATVGFAWAVLWPSLDAFRNLVQGVAVYTRRTGAISWSMVVFLVVTAAILIGGVVTQRFPALPVAMVAFVLATAAQVGWLRLAVRREMAELAQS
ncbi:MAG: hypothetical protein WDA03_08720 [Trueperaceae bacterium]